MAKTATAPSKNDAYTGLLAISLLAMIGACVLLYLDFDNYEKRTPPKAPVIDVPNAKVGPAPPSQGRPQPKAAEPPEEKKAPDPNDPNAKAPDPNDPNAKKDPNMMMRAPAKRPEVIVAKPAIELPPMPPEIVPTIPSVVPATSIEDVSIPPVVKPMPEVVKPAPKKPALVPANPDDPPLTIPTFRPE